MTLFIGKINKIANFSAQFLLVGHKNLFAVRGNDSLPLLPCTSAPLKQNNTELMKTNTVPKGYRLRPETHRLIEKVQYELRCSKDKVISEAVKLYHKEVKKTNNKNNK